MLGHHCIIRTVPHNDFHFGDVKAKPTDRGWCQGWVAGALRDNFLALVADADAAESAQ